MICARKVAQVLQAKCYNQISPDGIIDHFYALDYEVVLIQTFLLHPPTCRRSVNPGEQPVIIHSCVQASKLRGSIKVACKAKPEGTLYPARLHSNARFDLKYAAMLMVLSLVVNLAA